MKLKNTSLWSIFSLKQGRETLTEKEHKYLLIKTERLHCKDTPSLQLYWTPWSLWGQRFQWLMLTIQWNHQLLLLAKFPTYETGSLLCFFFYNTFITLVCYLKSEFRRILMRCALGLSQFCEKIFYKAKHNLLVFWNRFINHLSSF